MKAIDTHAHLWTVAYLDRIEALGSEGVEIARMMKATDSEADLAERFRMMDEAGVARQVISATPQVPEYGSAEEALAAAREINDAYKATLDRYPGRFLAYGAVPLPHIDEAIAEARRVIGELGMVGIALNTYLHQGLTLGDARLLPFFEAMNDLEARIYIHPTGFGACSPMVNDYRLEWVVGAPLEDGLAVLELLKAGVPARFPKIRFHVAHLGGFLPFLMQRIEDNYEDWDAFVESPWESVRAHFHFDTANFHGPALRCSVDTFGAERFFMGSDFPYFKDDKYLRAVTYIREAGLDPASTDAILSGNAIDFFQIKDL